MSAAIRRLSGWLLLAVLCGPAAGQSNSLLRQMTPAAGAPTSQPARGGPVIGGAPPATGPGVAVTGPEIPAENVVLQAVSPIAVDPPEPQTIRVHDLVTIIVREDKQSLSDARSQSDKKWQIDSEFTRWFRLNPEDHLVGQEFDDPVPGVKFDYDSKYNGKGVLNRKDSLVLRITAEVIDVKPNGNLVLEAKKRIKNDEDEQIVTLTGACRARDVTPQNTVLSTQMADVVINSSNTGMVRDATRRGWLKKLVDFLRPI